MRVTYDLRTQPWSLGDLLLFLGVCRTKFGSFEVNFRFDENIRPAHFEFIPQQPGKHLQLMLDTATCIHGCDAVGVSGESSEWPETTSYYLHYWLLDQLKTWPTLECKHKFQEWARDFMFSYGTEGVCHVRRHPYISDGRNSNIPAWKEFFDRMNCRVALLGDVPELETKKAVVPKAGVGCQLALVELCQWYMGASSGPLTMAWFGSAPYRVFNASIPEQYPYKNGSMTKGPENKWFLGQETADLLLAQQQELVMEPA